jgi:phage protein D
MATAAPYYAPEFQLRINGQAVPAPLRASIMSVTCQNGIEGADRVELSIVNENLRWLDHPLLAVDNELSLSLGYAPDPLEQVFVGDIVGQSATFPSSGSPALTVIAHDRRHRLQQGTASRWFAIPTQCYGNFPISDLSVTSLVSLEQRLIPVFDPVGAALAAILGGVEVLVQLGDPDARQKMIRKQMGESNYDFLQLIAKENGWDMVIDHSGAMGGSNLRFFSPLSHLTPDMTFKFGQSLLDFSPRLTTVGQVAAVSARIWKPEIKTEFNIKVSWDWDRNSLNVNISSGIGQSAAPAEVDKGKKSDAEVLLLEEPINQFTGPRVIVRKLLDRLNKRLTASGSIIGEPRLKPTMVVRIENVGEKFGGFYRITAVTHTLDGSGFRTNFEARKEIWFGSIPLIEQGAARVQLQGQTVRLAG